MNTIKIGPIECDLSQATEHWINEQINQRRSDDEKVCVQITLHTDGIDLHLSTCPTGGGGGRPPNRLEAEIIHLWTKLGLNTSQFSSGNVVAFVKQIRRYI